MEYFNNIMTLLGLYTYRVINVLKGHNMNTYEIVTIDNAYLTRLSQLRVNGDIYEFDIEYSTSDIGVITTLTIYTLPAMEVKKLNNNFNFKKSLKKFTF
jgi:hypothetical protein